MSDQNEAVHLVVVASWQVALKPPNRTYLVNSHFVYLDFSGSLIKYH